MNRIKIAMLMALGTLMGQAQTFDLRCPMTAEVHNLMEHDLHRNEATTERTLRAPQHTAEVTDQQQYTSFQISFYDGAKFEMEGGAFTTYKTTVTWYDDGSVALDNLFNLRTHNGDGDQEQTLWGYYDESTRRIVIPTSMDHLVQVGLLYGVLDGYLLGGTVGEEMAFYAQDAYELEVSEDGLAISTLQHALILEEYNDELSTHTCIKQIKMYRPCEGAKLEAMYDEEVRFGHASFPDEQLTRDLYIVNVGTESLNYTATLEGEDAEAGVFGLSPTTGTMRSMIMRKLKLTYHPTEEGEHEARLVVTSDGGDATATVKAECQDYPDYDLIVEEGDIAFRTGVDFPFVIALSEGDFVAQSTARTEVGESWLEANVEVPEGMIGIVRWAGRTYSDFYMGSKATVTMDDGKRLFESYMGQERIDGQCRFLPGHHTVTFHYAAQYLQFMTEYDRMEIESIGLELLPIVEDNAWLPYGQEVGFGNFVEGQKPQTLSVRLQNLGENPLKVAGIEQTEHFAARWIEDENVGTLDTMYVDVTFDLPSAGRYEDILTLHTTAGDFDLHCSALVRVVPDYSQIMAEDTDRSVEVRWTYSTQYPFVIDEETREAVNSNARELDTVANTSWMEASFDIPEGKIGIVSWDASLDIEDANDEGYYHDYGMVFIAHPLRQFGIIDIGQGDLSSEGCYGRWDDVDVATAEFYTTGENWIRWSLSHFGDSYYEGTDEMRISNLRIELMDFDNYSYKLDKDTIDFGQALVGRSNLMTVDLTSLGGKTLEIDTVECDLPVRLALLPQKGLGYKMTTSIYLYFDAIGEGEYEGEVSIMTNAGQIDVPYRAVGVDPTGFVMAEDFEDQMRWFRTDADGDGKSWNSLYNIYSTMSLGHCHSGEDGLGSSGYYFYMGDVDPDEWTYSPMVEIPAEGSYELEWWMGVDPEDEDRYQHHYEVYVGEEMDRTTMTQVYAEEIGRTGWQKRNVGLEEWAGKTVCVAFRHLDSKGLGIMKLDDVMIRPVRTNTIATVGQDCRTVSVYTLQGIRTKGLTKGVNMVRGKDVRKVIIHN